MADTLTVPAPAGEDINKVQQQATEIARNDVDAALASQTAEPLPRTDGDAEAEDLSKKAWEGSAWTGIAPKPEVAAAGPITEVPSPLVPGISEPASPPENLTLGQQPAVTTVEAASSEVQPDPVQDGLQAVKGMQASGNGLGLSTSPGPSPSVLEKGPYGMDTTGAAGM